MDCDSKLLFYFNISVNLVQEMKILIVDDNALCIKLLTYILKKYSQDIICVESGIQAIETIRENPDIDLILMDILLPEMDGYEATRKIREFNPEVIIIAQTALALCGEREKSIEAGCNDYISKPYKINDLLNIIQRNLTTLNYKSSLNAVDITGLL